MSGNVGRSSVEELIRGIRDSYNKSKISSPEMSCDLVDTKLTRLADAKKTAAAMAVARSSKKSEWMSRKRAFHERMIAKSMTVAATSCSGPRGCSDHAPSGKLTASCSCENVKSFSNRSLNSTKQFSSCERIPQVLNAPRALIKHTIGEIVLQLEKRIILHVYPGSEQIYYGPLEDIREVINAEPDKNTRANLLRALDCRIQKLQPLGWDMDYHVTFGNTIMQRYGIGAPAWFYDEPNPLVTHAQLARIVTKKLPLNERLNMMTILSCLLSLALEDGRPLFLTSEGEHFKTMES